MVPENIVVNKQMVDRKIPQAWPDFEFGIARTTADFALLTTCLQANGQLVVSFSGQMLQILALRFSECQL